MSKVFPYHSPQVVINLVCMYIHVHVHVSIMFSVLIYMHMCLGLLEL